MYRVFVDVVVVVVSSFSLRESLVGSILSMFGGGCSGCCNG